MVINTGYSQYQRMFESDQKQIFKLKVHLRHHQSRHEVMYLIYTLSLFNFLVFRQVLIQTNN